MTAVLGTRNWREMVDWSAAVLRRGTGEGVPEWNRRVLESGIDNEAELRAWLRAREVTGYAQLLLVMERFGYPELSTTSEWIDIQYVDRPELRPILDRLLAEAALLGPMHVRPRRTHVSLLTPRRVFALVKPTTRDRVDLGLRLPDVAPSGKLELARSMGGEATGRIGVRSADDVDDETLDWLRRAYAANR
jgi:Domain of unknown function (DUF5655)